MVGTIYTFLSQAGFDPPWQSETSYEADALPPSHHGWMKQLKYVKQILAFWRENQLNREFLQKQRMWRKYFLWT